MDALSIAEVLPDARLLARHALRTGQLAENNSLFAEIDAAVQALARGECPAVAPLVAAMNRVSAEAGITLEELHRRETATGRFSQRAALITPYLIGLLTLLLTVYLSFQSSELHKADLALREHQDLIGEHLPEKIYFAWKMYHYEKVLNVQAPTLAQLDGYQKLVADAKRLNTKLAAVRTMLIEASVMRLVPGLFQVYGPCWSRQVANALNAQALVVMDCTDAPVQTSSLQEATQLPAFAPLPAPQASALRASETQLDPGKPLCPKSTDLAMVETKIDLEGYESSIQCFVHSLQIADYNVPLDDSIYLVRNKLFLLVSWLLPCLYGLLGACVFLMRKLLFVNGGRGLRNDARIVDLLSLVLRIALGGLAGIIIGWFWVPTGLSSSSVSISVSSVPFGMAFLAGFSIDSLFTLLDRLNRTIGADDGKAAVAPKPAVADAPATPGSPREVGG